MNGGISQDVIIMTKEETKGLFRRIKAHYQEFSIDEFKLDEWYKELKQYSYEDITSRFELHLSSEEYGQLPPKLWFLKKNLRTIDEKKEAAHFKHPVICQICGKPIDLRIYDNHFNKCSAINYMQRELQRIYNKQVSREQLENMSEDQFQAKYDTMLSIVRKNPSFKEQISVIDSIFGITNDLTVEGVLKSL